MSNHPAGLIYGEEINIESRSWENIHGFYLDNNAEKTVYYFHWNGAPIAYFYTDMLYIADLWYNVMSYDFPWYGKSTGTPTQEETKIFSQDFYNYIKQEKNLKDEDVIIWWYSVGTAVAIDFIGEQVFESLILFSPLASRYDMSSKVFGFPIQKLFFMKNSFISYETIRSITIPTFIVHGNTDDVVPFPQWKKVFENSGASQKYFLEIDNFGHSLIVERYGDVLDNYITSFLETHTLDEEYIFLSRDVAQDILSQEHFLKNLDVETDDSMTKFVNPDVPFQDVTYIPADLEYLSRDYIVDTKWNAQLRTEAREQFEQMAEKFYQDFGEKIVVVSSYRSYTYQAGIKARGCPDNLCAKAGYSEHQSWLAIDLWSASTDAYWKSNSIFMEYYDWLSENAHLYGFHNTYQRGRDVDGYEIEPWHWRYVEKELATYLRTQDITFAEFYNQILDK